MNNQCRGRCYLPKPKPRAEADNTVTTFDTSQDIIRKPNSIIAFIILFLNNVLKKTFLSEFAKV